MKYYNYPNGTEVAENVDSKNISQYGGGGAGVGVMRIGINMQTMALDKTWQEIWDCFANGGYAYVAVNTASTSATFMPIVGVANPGRYDYFVYAFTAEGTMQAMQFTCSSPDEYPVYANDEVNN